MFVMAYIKNCLRSSVAVIGGGWYEAFGEPNICQTYDFYRSYNVVFITNYRDHCECRVLASYARAAPCRKIRP